VCQSILSAELRDDYARSVRADYDKIRIQHQGKKGQVLVPLPRARANAFVTEWSAYTPPAPKLLGRKLFHRYDLARIAPHIDWSPFFQTWDLAGSYPKILEDAEVGKVARSLLADARKMLDRLIAEKWLTANGVIALLPAASMGDDIEIYTDDSRPTSGGTPAMVWHNLRQQTEKPSDRPNFCLADFVAPRDSGARDYIGAFAVTTGIGLEERVRELEAKHDDYRAIMLKALADRLAEAFAEAMHARVRREFWGYAAAERLANEDLVAEKYRGIRPAPGYPACPDHTEKGPLFDLLGAGEIGMSLTESFAMLPASSVSGFYLSHPQAQYFAVGKIAEDQAEDYAQRKGLPIDITERWLAPVLAYDR
jgi:5-methyltetrahydrofolate--homocysteine methyltransferase